ncbi:hypothetical protein [Pelomonas sp. Root1217]|uniref:hypothetical protein n=1 Tax=Pelomonas sp. Root1217 TaxID=1736430 RepID=UPI000A9CBF26|nr:hypothetical protein [Pelomonas sp. Root1217]
MAFDANVRMATIAVAMALGLGWLLGAGGEEVGGVVQPRRDVWTLPDLPRKPDMASTGLALANSPLFEPEAAVNAATAASAVPEDLRWRIAGIFPRAGRQVVLISFIAPGKEPQRLRVGDRLPNGHRIQCIEHNEVCVQNGKKSYRMGVEYLGE